MSTANTATANMVTTTGTTHTGTTNSFGRLLRAHRHRLGLSLTQLAALVHYDRGHISKVETDKRQPSLRFAQACDRVLGTGTTFTSIATALETATHRSPNWPRPAQLPAARRDFVGREDLLAHLDTLLLHAERSVSVPVVVIEGPPGIGKTELAVQWARRSVNRGHFADGQLYVDLRAEVPPTDLLADVLVALGVPQPLIPTSPEQRAATFRSLLDGREMLLVLDNATHAAHAQQIHALLPGSPGCAVLVTSRTRLPCLTSRLGAVTLTVPELTADEAVALVHSITGDRHTDPPHTIPAVAELCGHLPLALVLAAEHIVSHHDVVRPASSWPSGAVRTGPRSGAGPTRSALRR